MDVSPDHNRTNTADPISTMRNFLLAGGGSVRFDAFAHEHLVGERGFYSTQINLSLCHAPVPTPMSSVPPYRAIYVDIVLAALQQTAIRTERTTGLVCEIGPGGGEFYNNLLEEFNTKKGNYFPLQKLEYVAIDPNISHLAAIKEKGGKVLRGMLQKIPLDAQTVDVIIAEEVFDSLPYRAFRWDPAQKKLLGELLVNLADPGLRVELGSLEQDEHTDLISQHLAAISYPGHRYDYSPLYLEVWRELRRVLSPQGIVVLGDYSTKAPLQSAMSKRGVPDFNTLFAQEVDVARNPYLRDLTHYIDFELQVRLAGDAGFLQSEIIDPVEFFDGQDVGEEAVAAALSFLTAGRRILISSGSRVTPKKSGQSREQATAELYSLGNSTHGCQNVLRLLAAQPEASEVAEIFKRNELRGGAFWAIYSDLASNNIRTFVTLVLSEEKSVLEYAKRYSD